MNYKSFKIRLDLNNKQLTLCNKHSGVARHAYNWGAKLYLDIFDQNFESFKDESNTKEKINFPSSIDLHKKLVAEVKSQFPWYYEVSKCAPQQALRDLHSALLNYFRKLKSGEISKLKKDYIKKKSKHNGVINPNKLNNLGKPKFKKKGINDSFYLEGPNINIEGNKIKLPAFGWVRLSESLEINDKIKNVTLSKKGNNWFVSFKIEKNIVSLPKPYGAVGVDLGVKTLATLSNGKVFSGSKPYKTYKWKLKIEQRKLNKKYNKDVKEQSKNYKKHRRFHG